MPRTAWHWVLGFPGSCWSPLAGSWCTGCHQTSPCPVLCSPRNLCQMQEDNSGFSLLLDLLSELYQKQPKIGYHLLYYLKAR